MNKIFASLLVIGAVLGIAGAGTWAIFTDDEQSTGNTFTTGTIDISVDGQNPWTKSYQVTSTEGCGTGQTKTTKLKPCYIGYIEFPVKNVGDNPANVFLSLDNVVDSNVVISEPEHEEDPTDQENDISNHISIDLNGKWLDETLNGIQGDKLYLGHFQPDEEKKVSISFHLDINAGNEYQGDQSTFDINLYAVQLKAEDNPNDGS